MRMIILIAFVMVAGCGKSPQTPDDPNENTMQLFGDTVEIKTDTEWPVMVRSGHVVVSVYPPVTSKVKLEVENTDGQWSPMDQSDPLANETMIVVPYRVANVSHATSFAIDDSVTIICKLADWRDRKRHIGSIDHHKPEFDDSSPKRVVAPADGYLGGIVQNRPYKLPPGASAAGAAVFRAVDIATLTDGDDRNLAISCVVASDSTGNKAALMVDIPASFVVPK